MMGISTLQSDSQELAKREEGKGKKIFFLCVCTRRAVKSALISVCLQCVCLSMDLFQLHVGVTPLLLLVVLSQQKAGVKQMNQTPDISGNACYLGSLVRRWCFIGESLMKLRNEPRPCAALAAPGAVLPHVPNSSCHAACFVREFTLHLKRQLGAEAPKIKG